jgi:hypothetical protein
MHTYANDCTLSEPAPRPQQSSDSSADSDTFFQLHLFDEEKERRWMGNNNGNKTIVVYIRRGLDN